MYKRDSATILLVCSQKYLVEKHFFQKNYKIIESKTLKKILIFLILFILLLAFLPFFVATVYEHEDKKEADCYFGVSFCGNTTAEAMLLIDRVKDYTNVIVIQSGPVSWNETATNEVCHYAVESGLDIIVYFGDLSPRALEKKLNETGIDLFWRLTWISTAKEKYGENFLGVYYYDESGGIWLDQIESINTTRFVNPTYDSIAELFTAFLPNDRGYQALKNNSINVYASDYALYWFDYKMGYDTILAQAGWNHTLEQDIAMLRGAATIQNKSWGTIITWKYENPPYLDTAENIYNQMEMSYKAGAQYIILFNYPTYPKENQYGVMTDSHFETMERFWNDVVTNEHTTCGSKKAELALVIPENYGWGMRWIDDTIWGLWGPDEKSEQIWNISRQLLEEYGNKFDIIYEDPEFQITTRYSQIIYWNQSLTSDP
jgi:hypothetical protein